MTEPLIRTVVIGAGGQARDTAWLLAELNREKPRYTFLGFIVSDLNTLSAHDSRDRILGDESWLHAHPDDFDAIVLGIGTPAARRRVGQHLKKRFASARWPTLIHPTAVLDFSTLEVDGGCHGRRRCCRKRQHPVGRI